MARLVFAALLVVLLMAAELAAQPSLAAARELYDSAQYDAALDVLDSLTPEGASNEELLSVDLYRALCLLAVGREDDADRSMEQVVTRNSLFRPGDDLPPRARLAFSEARRRVLPALIQQQYAEAKRIFDRDEFESAAAAFQLVIDAIRDPDLGAAAQQSPLSDLLTLAVGFHDLSVKAIPPPPPPAPPSAPVVEQPPRIYGGEDASVRPPVTIAQDLPRFPGIVPLSGITGVVEVIIDERGSVETGNVIVSMTSAYDKLVMNAARRWQYRPAMLNGTPVKFRKRVQIAIAPAK